MGRGVAKVVQAKFDAKTLHERPAVAAEARMVDDGSGAKEVFRQESFESSSLLSIQFSNFQHLLKGGEL